MTTKTFAVLLMLISLLTQQVSASVMTASMLGDSSSTVSSDMQSDQMMGMSHQHHQMSSGDDMTEEMEDMDCCQTDCANCQASCQNIVFASPLRFSSANFKDTFPLDSSEPLVQPSGSPFRPPIVA